MISVELRVRGGGGDSNSTSNNRGAAPLWVGKQHDFVRSIPFIKLNQTHFCEPRNCLRVPSRDTQRLSRGVGWEDAPPLASRDERVPRRRCKGIDVHASARPRGSDEEPAVRRSPALTAQVKQVISEVLRNLLKRAMTARVK